MSTQDLSPTEKVAKLLVEHWIYFKGCEEHSSDQQKEAELGIKEFIDRHSDLL